MSTEKKARGRVVNDATEDFNKLQEQGVTTVDLQVKRINNQGHWMSIKGLGSLMMDVDKCLAGGVEEKLEELGVGGGTFILQVREFGNPGNVYFKWRIVIPGPPLNPQARAPETAGATGAGAAGGPRRVRVAGPAGPGWGGAPAGTQLIHGVPVPESALRAGLPTPSVDGYRQLSPPPEVPSWAKHEPLSNQWMIYYAEMAKRGKLEVSEGVTAHYAGLFDQRAQAAMVEKETLRERLSIQEREHNRELDTLKQQLAKMEIERREEKHAMELRALEMRIEAATQRQPEPSALSQFTPLIIQTLPAILTAMNGFRSTAETARVEREKLAQQQHQQTLALLSDGKKSQTDIIALLTTVAPIVIKLMDRPLEQKAMQQEHQMLLMQLLFEQIQQQALAQGEQPLWWPIVESVIASIPDLANFWQKVQATKAQQARALPQQGPASVDQIPPATRAMLGDGVLERFAARGDVERQAAQEVAAIYQNIPPEWGFHTHAWRNLLLNMHALTDPRQLAPAMGEHLVHSARHGELPGALESVLENPEAALTPVLQQLPVARRDPQYTQALLTLLCQWVHNFVQNGDGDEYEDADEDENAEEEAASGVVEAMGRDVSPIGSAVPFSFESADAREEEVEEDEDEAEEDDEEELESDAPRNALREQPQSQEA